LEFKDSPLPLEYYITVGDLDYTITAVNKTAEGIVTVAFYYKDNETDEYKLDKVKSDASKASISGSL
jgi:hypothetical protein